MIRQMSLVLGIVSLTSLFTAEVSAQGMAQAPTADVCCISQEKSGEMITTAAEFLTARDCKPGRTTPRGRTVCSSSSDLDNCSALGEKDRCLKCGFFWLDQGVCSSKSPEELFKETQEGKPKK